MKRRRKGKCQCVSAVDVDVDVDVRMCGCVSVCLCVCVCDAEGALISGNDGERTENSTSRRRRRGTDEGRRTRIRILEGPANGEEYFRLNLIERLRAWGRVSIMHEHEYHTGRLYRSNNIVWI